MRRPAALLALAVALAGCPIPQPLPDYPPGTITPPRILVDGLLALDDRAVILVPANCTTTQPTYVLKPSVVDSNTNESVEARWFVNYDHRETSYNEIRASSVIPPNTDTTNLVRAIPPFVFEPYQYPPPYGTTPQPGPKWDQSGIVRVVELVVSNGFDPALIETTSKGANRAVFESFETQVHRWVYLTSDTVPCP